MTRPLLLVTNDDGIDSLFLHVLCDAHRPFFRVCVAAPKSEQSWVGRSFSRLRPVAVEPRTLPCADEAWAVDGTPSDCVNIALGSLLGARHPAAVISGINIGFNITMPLCLSSGTLAGAIEGSAWGLPALAFSLELPDPEYLHAQRHNGEIHGIGLASLRCAARRAVAFTRRVLDETQNSPAAATDSTSAARNIGEPPMPLSTTAACATNAADAPLLVHNINFPRVCTDATPVEITTPATVRSGSLYREETPGVYRFHWNKAASPAPFPAASDAACIQRGHISHTLHTPA